MVIYVYELVNNRQYRVWTIADNSRLGKDMIEAWKHLNGKYEVNKDLLVEYEDETSRGDTRKLKKVRWERATRQIFFAY